MSRFNQSTTFMLLTLLSGLLLSCVATDSQGRVLPEPEEEAATAEPGDLQAMQIEAVIAGVSSDRGSKLLQNLQWLIQMRGIAVPHLVKALPEVSPRVRANLLYVLGFTSIDESAAALQSYLADADPITRYEAAAGLLNHGDFSSVPILMSFLESDDRHMRYKAIEVLRAGTGKEFGYAFSQPVSYRTEAVQKWKSWWANEKRRLMRLPSVTATESDS